jgi:metal-dependent amidase/aminoacylase/carboxypeptidase family protein
LSIGVKPEEIKDCAMTGLVVDIKGTGPADSSGPCQTVALRGDMDGLPIPENN